MSLCTRHEPKIDLGVENFMKMAIFLEKNSRTPKTLCSPVKLCFLLRIFYILSDKAEKNEFMYQAQAENRP